MSDRFARAAAAPPLIWLGLFLVAPVVIVLAISLSHATDASPPYAPLIERAAGAWRIAAVTDNYALLAGDDLYPWAFVNAARISLVSTLGTLAIGYPMAYAIARAPRHRRSWLLIAVIVPFWTSYLIRIYAWATILRPSGLINTALLSLGVIDEPLALSANEFAIHLGIIYCYLPFMLLPIYAALEKQDRALVEAARDLGASPWRSFLAVTLPLSWAGVAAGGLLVFIPAFGEFVIPDLLGGPDTPMIGRVLWTEFFINRDWPVAAALAMVMIGVLAAPILAFLRLGGGRTG